MPIGTSDGQQYEDEFDQALQNAPKVQLAQATPDPDKRWINQMSPKEQEDLLKGSQKTIGDFTPQEIEDAVDRYGKLRIWDKHPVLDQLSPDIERHDLHEHNNEYDREFSGETTILRRKKPPLTSENEGTSQTYTSDMLDTVSPTNPKTIIDYVGDDYRQIGSIMQKAGFLLPKESDPQSENVEDRRNPSIGDYLAYAFTNHSVEQLKDMLSHPLTKFEDPQHKAYKEMIEGPKLPTKAPSTLAKAAGYEDIDPQEKLWMQTKEKLAEAIARADKILNKEKVDDK